MRGGACARSQSRTLVAELAAELLALGGARRRLPRRLPHGPRRRRHPSCSRRSSRSCATRCALIFRRRSATAAGRGARLAPRRCRTRRHRRRSAAAGAAARRAAAQPASGAAAAPTASRSRSSSPSPRTRTSIRTSTRETASTSVAHDALPDRRVAPFAAGVALGRGRAVWADRFGPNLRLRSFAAARRRRAHDRRVPCGGRAAVGNNLDGHPTQCKVDAPSEPPSAAPAVAHCGGVTAKPCSSASSAAAASSSAKCASSDCGRRRRRRSASAGARGRCGDQPEVLLEEARPSSRYRRGRRVAPHL